MTLGDSWAFQILPCDGSDGSGWWLSAIEALKFELHRRSALHLAKRAPKQRAVLFHLDTLRLLQFQ